MNGVDGSGAVIDVIMPLRDRASTVSAALASVAAQCLADVQVRLDVTVIDGASRDAGPHLAHDWGSTVVLQCGTGLAAARNQGVTGSTAPYVAFLDADDRWTPTAVADRLRPLLADPSLDGVTGSLVVEALEGGLPSRFVGRDVRPVRGLTPGALLARRSLFDRVGPFDESMVVGADTDWFARAADLGARVEHVDTVVLIKGVGSDNLSHDLDRYRAELLTIAHRHVARRRSDRV